METSNEKKVSTVNERMKLLRSQSDVTLKEMANIIGVSEATVQRYESGVITKVPYKAIVAYAKKFNTYPSYIMGWTEFPNQPTIFDVDHKDAKSFLEENIARDYVITKKEKDAQEKEEQLIVECYRELSVAEKDMVKRMLKYYEKLADISKEKE